MGCMYLEITTRCNMKCPHCCVDAKLKGTVMSKDTFLNALRLMDKMIEHNDEIYLTVGGGEPTLCKQFMPYVRKLMERNRQGTHISLAVITNGTRPKKIRAYEDYRDRMGFSEEEMSMSLSTDQFHDLSMVSPEVYERFKRLKRTHGPGGWSQVVPVGRARKNGIGDPLDTMSYNGIDTYRRCVCSSMIVRANGNVVPCGCEDAPIIGNVNHIDEKLEDFLQYASYGDCWHDGDSKFDPEEDNYRGFRDRYGYDYPAKDTLALTRRYSIKEAS